MALMRYTRESVRDADDVCDVLIIGGGLSGLVAAYELNCRRPSCRICLLERHKRCGGQIKSADDGELGARWISADQINVCRLCAELGLWLEPRFGETEGGMLRDWDLDGGPLAAVARFELQRYVRYMTLVARDFRPKAFHAWSQRPMELVLCAQLFCESARNVARLLVRAACGCSADAVSYRDYLAVCHSTRGLRNQLDALSGHGEQLRIAPNAGALVRALLDRLAAADAVRIRLMTRVDVLSTFDSHSFAICSNGSRVGARTVIVAIPWQEVERIKFGPSLPAELRIANPRHRHMISAFVLRYAEPFWRNEYHTGSMMHFFGAGEALIVYETGGATLAGMLFHQRTDAAFDPVLEMVMPWLCERFSQAFETPAAASYKTWEQAAVRGRTPTAVWQQIVWASSNSGALWRGHLNGAVQAGQRAAYQTLNALQANSIGEQDLSRLHNKNEPAPKLSGRLEMWCASLNVYGCARWLIGVPLACGTAYALVHKWRGAGGVRIGSLY